MYERDNIPAEEIYAPILSIYGLQFLVFIVAVIIKDNSIIDITWGLVIWFPNFLITLLRDTVDNK